MNIEQINQTLAKIFRKEKNGLCSGMMEIKNLIGLLVTGNYGSKNPLQQKVKLWKTPPNKIVLIL